MIKKIYILFKLARKLAMSDAIKIVSKIHEPPLIIKVFFRIFSFSFNRGINKNHSSPEEER